MRLALALSLLLGGGGYFIDLYRFLMHYLGPVLDRTMLLLAGPGSIALPILFLEKLLKALLSCLFCGGLVLCFQNFCSKRKPKGPYLLICVGLGLSFYFLLSDFIYIRKIALYAAHKPFINKLITCQLGRLLLVLGSISLLRFFATLPGVAVFFSIFIYVLGVYSLAFSASANVFPVV